jgi:YaiO family outer membrane protein
MNIYVKLCFVILLLSGIPARAQVSVADSLLKESRTLASQEHYGAAIDIAKRLAAQYPQDISYAIYLGRLYGWSKAYDTAVRVLTPIVDRNPSNEEALQVLINTYLWKGDDDQVITLATKGLSLGSADSSFYLLKLAGAYHEKKQDQEAMKVLHNLPQPDRHSNEALALRTDIGKGKKNMLTFSYLNTAFHGSGAAPWHLASASYKRNTSLMPVELRVNYGNMYQLSATQLELDLYPAITKKSYLYVNAGVAEGKAIFPAFKAAVEYFTTPVHRLTLSGGARFLNFQPDPVWIFTAQVAYDFNSWQPAYRYFLSSVNNGTFSSHNISLRKTFALRESYIQLDLQYGNIPFSVFTTNELNRVNAVRAGLQARIRIGNSLFLSPAFMYEYEEYYPDLFRDRFNTQLVFSIRF